ncbi:uncharacterized protein TA04725 [Theileria annulata]|uniref:Ribosome quality control complex subunit 2 n=1 Tax=Theileria annulata TaxID=5874 RepID=Q4UBW3_THEAN|nr:uncharacterized protein TA04725 [Theileria annulata]CAI75688.1 hypothetical protein, conserved [Theileria annulata]|eukprot:XP_955164.1 hypothetical protein, conserved [Theileria annulata]
MAKERLNAVDVAVTVSNLKKLITNLTLVNIYDITNRVFILKFSKNENKIYILIEIGCRIHSTQFLRSVDHLPSNFNAKLRKHLRNRRLRDISQMSQDRVIDFTFSSEEYAHHLIVQLFLPGNIYLTDSEYKVLTVLRPQNTGDKFFKVGTNYVYDMDYNSWFEVVKKPLVEELIVGRKLTEIIKSIFPSIHNAFILSVLQFKLKNTRGESVDSKELDRVYNLDDLDTVYQYVECVRMYLSELLSGNKIPGYLYKNPRGEMEDFGLFEQENSEYFEDFNDAVDTFFTKHELAKQEKKSVDKRPTKINKIKIDQNKRELNLMEDIQKIDSKIKLLEEHVDVAENCLNLTKALIASGASWNDIYEQLQIQRKQNHPLVHYIKEIHIPTQTLIFYSNQNQDQHNEQNKQNQFQQNIQQKNENKQNKKNTRDEVVVELDYRLNSHQNLKKLYNERKRLENKLERTRIGKEYALKKVTKSLKKEENKKTDKKGRDVKISSVRRRFWFEKFYWFITSQGYLVLAGRDALQNELLVKKYLTNGDLYFHADIHGASSVILKTNSTSNNNTFNLSNSTNTATTSTTGTTTTSLDNENSNVEDVSKRLKESIDEAGNFAVCLSTAWNEKFSVQSWWVYWHQVSKTPPTGEYVPQGSFVIRGKKNYLPPQKLEMGITYLFQVQPFHSLDEPIQDNENVEGDVVEGDEPGDHESEDEEDDQEPLEGEDTVVSDDEDDEEGDTEEEDGEGEEEDTVEDEDEVTVNDDEEDTEDPDNTLEGEDEEDTEDPDNTLEDEDADDTLETDDPEELDVQEDSETEDTVEKSVRIGHVEMLEEYEANINKRTRGRLPTAHPLKFKLLKLKNQLQKLNLTKHSSKSSKSSSNQLSTKSSTDHSTELPTKSSTDQTDQQDELIDSVDPNTKSTLRKSVRILEPEKLEHTEEAVRKIRSRKLTCLNPNLSKLNDFIPFETQDSDDKINTDTVKCDVKLKNTNTELKNPKTEPKNMNTEVKNVKEDKKRGSNRMMRFINQKVNKIKKKYGQDDEETQELRRLLTGSKKIQQKSQKTQITTTSITINQTGKFSHGNSVVSSQGGKFKEIETISDKELEYYMKQLSCLTKDLKEDDDVINVIPMCAPYSAIKHYKNALKLVPGNSKKGTIATQSLQHFIKNDPERANYLKLITTDQLTLTLIGNCKFTSSKM